MTENNYKIINMDDVEIEHVEWLWEGFIPVGKLTMLHGDPGKGKTMAMLNPQQVSLLAYRILRDEVMDGGFVQLIHNGYGPFFFNNPFGKVMRNWGLDELATLINKAHRLYKKYHVEIEKECGDEEFMALFEQFADFDECDDIFVEHEEEWTAKVAAYIDDHIDDFATIQG